MRAYLLRSPMAHGRITTLDVAEAREAPGVELVLTGADIVAHGLKNAMKGSTVDNRDGSKGAAPVRPIPRRHPCAPRGRTRGLHRRRNAGAGAGRG